MTSRPRDARRRLRRHLAAGLLLAFGVTVFLDVALLVVPIYDMQLYDRVLKSRNMDTLAALSLACAAGLALFALLDYLRSACFVALGNALGRLLHGVVIEQGVRRTADGDAAAGPQLVRDLNELQGFLASGAAAVPLDALCAPMFLLVMFMLHPAYFWLGAAAVAALVLLGLLADLLARPALVAAQAREARAAQVLSRRLAEPELADGLGMLPAIGRRWAREHGQALAALRAAGTRALAVAGVSRVVRLCFQAGVMVLGAALILAGATTPGSLMGANLLLNKLMGPFDHLVASWRHWALARAAWTRIDLLLAGAPDDAPEAGNAGAAPGLVIRDAAARAADGRVLLRGVSAAVPPGSILAVAGPNGAGKTTLLRLLAGLAAPSAGAVLLDGRPVHGGPGTGFLPQDVGLLDGTVGENIARFRDGALDAAVAAARRAGVHEAVGRMARGYDTPLHDAGAALSGGMRQRVGLARALHGDPRLVVLDEPDASLDGEGGAALLGALRFLRDAGAVVVVTSHRPALLEAADFVLTLRDGAMAGFGPPARATPASPRDGAPDQQAAPFRAGIGAAGAALAVKGP